MRGENDNYHPNSAPSLCCGGRKRCGCRWCYLLRIGYLGYESTTMTTDKSLSLVTNCEFSGPPPEPYTYWTDYFNNVLEFGVLYSLKVSRTSNEYEPILSKETFGQMAKWMRYHYCRHRYSSSLLYGEMNTVHDLIKILDKISRGNFDSSLEEWNDYSSPSGEIKL